MAEESLEVEYPLTLSGGRRIAMVVCAIAVTLGICWVAVTNTRGLRIARIVTLSADAATVTYWVMAAFCGLFFTPLCLALAWGATFIKQRVGFTHSSIRIPRTNWSAKHVDVPFESIRSVSVVTVNRERVITLVLPDRKFRIGSHWLPSKAAFEDVLDRLQAGMRQPRLTHPVISVNRPAPG